MSYATLLRALPDDALIGFLKPKTALVATLLRQLSDEELSALYMPAIMPPDFVDELEAEMKSEQPKRRGSRALPEVDDAIVNQVGTAIDEEGGSIATLASRLGMEADVVRSACAKLCELGVVRKIGVGRGQTYESIQLGDSTSIQEAS